MAEGPEGKGGPVLDQKEKDSRLWGMLCHLSALAGLVVPFAGCVIGPLVIWMLKREEFPFVDDQGKEAVNFQIPFAIAFLVLFSPRYLFPMVFTVFGHTLFVLFMWLLSLAALGLGVVDLVLVVVASMKANEGVRYRYPINFHFIK